MNYENNLTHTFIVCAYKESPYLEDCLKSLLNQTIKTNIIIETSTPNEYINNLANKYGIQVIVNNGPSSCASDWNYGYNYANSNLVTIAHQDDIYYSNYVENILNAYKEDSIILFTDYEEIRNNLVVSNNKNLKIKRFMNSFIFKHPKSINTRRFILSFGDSISCPTVTFNKTRLKDDIFSNQLQCSVDYDAWERLSKIDGSFIYIPKILMAHRIYKDSSTTKFLSNNTRQKEDFEILSRFWPRWLAKIIYKLYSNSEKSNNV